MIWVGRWEGGSGLGTHLHPWQIHVNVWQNQDSIVKQNKVKIKIKKKKKSPLDCKEIQPVHPKEISPGCSLEGLMLKLKLQFFGHLM